MHRRHGCGRARHRDMTRHGEKRHEHSERCPIRIATTDGIAGARIATTLGVVVGIAIRSRGVGGNIMAGLDALGNGSALDEYRDDLAATVEGRSPPLGEGAEHHLRIGSRTEDVPGGLELGSQSPEVVELAVVGERCTAILSDHRLMPGGGQVDDAQAGVGEADAVGRQQQLTSIVGTAVRDGREHGAQLVWWTSDARRQRPAYEAAHRVGPSVMAVGQRWPACRVVPGARPPGCQR